MTSGYKFGVLVGVSSDRQSRDDKASIPDQIQVCRDFIRDTGGVEVDLYVMDGYSRTGYDSLQDAMVDIPPLKRAIEDMQAGKYNILLLDNYDRLGDLGKLVYTRFRRHKKQFHSVRQSGRLQDPDLYNPLLDSSGIIDMSVQSIIQSYRLDKLGRGFQIGMSKRVEDGKYSTTYPKAVYKKVMLNEKEWQLERKEPQASILIQMKDAFLRGTSLHELEQMGKETGTVGPNGGEWRRSTIHKLLTNPFMAGKVFRNRYKTIGWHNSKNGKRVYDKKKNAEPELMDGNHPALWTFEEYKRILEECYMRQHLIPKKSKYTLSGLLICGICGKRINIFLRGKYRCSNPHPGQEYVKMEDMVERVAPALVDALRNYTGKENEQQPESNVTESVAVIEAQIDRVHRGYEIGIYNDQQAKDRTDKLKAQKQAILNNAQSKQEQKEQHKRIMSMRDELLPVLDKIPQMLRERDGKTNNLFLRRFLKGIVVKDGEFVFLWR